MAKEKNKALVITKKVNAYIKNIEKYLKENGMYEAIDVAVIDNLRDSYKTILQAQEAIDEFGLMIQTDKGLQPNKAHKIKFDSVIRMEKCLEILGVQGKQRYKDNLKAEVKEDESPLDKLMKGEL